MNATHLQNMFMPDTRRRDDWERSLGWFGVGIDRRTFRDDTRRRDDWERSLGWFGVGIDRRTFGDDTRRRDDWERSLGWFGVGIDRRTFRDDSTGDGSIVGCVPIWDAAMCNILHILRRARGWDTSLCGN